MRHGRSPGGRGGGRDVATGGCGGPPRPWPGRRRRRGRRTRGRRRPAATARGRQNRGWCGGSAETCGRTPANNGRISEVSDNARGSAASRRSTKAGMTPRGDPAPTQELCLLLYCTLATHDPHRMIDEPRLYTGRRHTEGRPHTHDVRAAPRPRHAGDQHAATESRHRTTTGCGAATTNRLAVVTGWCSALAGSTLHDGPLCGRNVQLA